MTKGKGKRASGSAGGTGPTPSRGHGSGTSDTRGSLRRRGADRHGSSTGGEKNATDGDTTAANAVRASRGASNGAVDGGTGGCGEVIASSTVVGAVVAAVYHRTLQASIPGGDSGELVAEACVLGVAHPPGYPLFTLWTRLVMDWLPAAVAGQPPAWHANAASAMCAAGAAAFLCATVGLLGSNGGHSWMGAMAGVCASLCYALSPLVWGYSVTAEVFAMNNLFVAMLLCCAAVYARCPSQARALLGAFVCGLALTNQHTIVLFEVPVIGWVLWDLLSRRALSPRLFGMLTASFVAGLVPYAYLPWASARVTAGSWGDLTSVQGFMKHLLRSEYGTFQLSPMESKSYMRDRLALYGRHLSDAFPLAPLSLALVAAGAAWSLWRVARSGVRATGTSKPRARTAVGSRTGAGAAEQRALNDTRAQAPVVIFVAWLFYVVVFHYLANLPTGAGNAMAEGVLARFWMQPDAAVAVMLGCGVIAVADLVARVSKSSGTVAVTGVVCVLLCVALPLLATQRLDEMDRSDEGGAAMSRFGHAVMDPLPAQSLLLSQTDLNWNTVRYLQACEGHRHDVTHISTQLMPYPWFQRQHSRYPNVTFPQVLPDATTDKTKMQHVRDICRFIDANLDAFPGGVYLDIHAVHDLHVRDGNQYLDSPFHLLPNGLTYKVVRAAAPGQPAAVLRQHRWLDSEQTALNTLDAAFQPAPTHKYPPGSWEHAGAKVFWDAHYQHGLLLLSTALNWGKGTAPHPNLTPADCLRRAAALLRDTVDAHDAGYPITYLVQDQLKNAALAHTQLLRNTQDAAEQAETAVQVLPLLERYLQGAQGDPDAGTFRQYLQVIRRTLQASGAASRATGTSSSGRAAEAGASTSRKSARASGSTRKKGRGTAARKATAQGAA